MARYAYECATCGEMEISHPMKQDALSRCPVCKSKVFGRIITTVPRLKIPDSGWENENGGKGRWISQLGKESDRESYCRSRGEAVDKAKKQGFQTIHLD